ncbi:MAG: hypothetical protein KF841_14370 [Phycisphaerae bacterium]|nr:hypothetical protein [Phycisphaerae bacterium]
MKQSPGPSREPSRPDFFARVGANKVAQRRSAARFEKRDAHHAAPCAARLGHHGTGPKRLALRKCPDICRTFGCAQVLSFPRVTPYFSNSLRRKRKSAFVTKSPRFLSDYPLL